VRLPFRRKAVPFAPVYCDDGTLALLVSAPDPARADSAVLAEAGLDLTQPVLVRHHLTLPASEVEQARALLAQDGYALTLDGEGAVVQVRAWRTQLLTALSASQERSRMAGLAQRLGGDVGGWDALGPAPSGSSPGSQ
jgi:hypothetical protein